MGFCGRSTFVVFITFYQLLLLSMAVLAFFVVLFVGSCFGNPHPYNKVHPNRTLVVLSAPSVWDDNYRDNFIDIISFQIDYARTIHEHENVVILADKHTIPYFDGRNPRISRSLPSDALIETNVYDVNINDFTPIGTRQFTKFVYRSEQIPDLTAIEIDRSIDRFLLDNHIRVDKRETEMTVSGEELIHNGVNKAIVADTLLEKNVGKLPDWAAMIKLLNTFKKVVVVPNPINGTRLRFDDVISFVDEEVVALSPVDPHAQRLITKLIAKKFNQDVHVIDLPLGGAPDDDGNCGIYTALMSTEKYVYVPVYGNDPENWKLGYSTMTDHVVLRLLGGSSRRKIVPINVPRAICKRGLSLRSMAWSLKGYAADQIINLARQNAP